MVDSEDALSIKSQCQMLSLSRSAHYYQSQKKEVNLDLKRALCDIYEDCPFYGYRKTVLELRAKGFNVGKKLVRTLKWELGLKTMYPEPKTSIPNKAHKKYPYLLRDVEITHVNQVWSADISYIPMGKSFVYIIGIIDWYSRKILSYRISNSMDRHFCIEALEEAFRKYGKPEVFNTDQGSQFTSSDFTEKLETNGIAISMDGKGRCLDNVFIERWFRSLKYEDIYLKNYEHVLALKAGVKRYVAFYNEKRYHQALDYLTPNQVYFAQASEQGTKVA
jgi:putative transposase